MRPTAAEREMRAVARRSIAATREIARGEEITAENVGLRRPGTGLAPALLDAVMGWRACRAIAKGKLLAFDDLAPAGGNPEGGTDGR